MLIVVVSDAQVIETTALNNKTYKVYTSLLEASNVNPNSVEGLVLCSNGFNDFPKEILKFKNLKYLNLCNYSWKHFKDSLSTEEIFKYDSIQKQSGVDIIFRPNYIQTIPRGLKKLKKLEIVDFSAIQVSDVAKRKMLKYLPKETERYPDYRILKTMRKEEK